MKRLLAVLATLTLVWVMLLPGCGGEGPSRLRP